MTCVAKSAFVSETNKGMRNGPSVDLYEAAVWRNEYRQILQERDELRSQLRQLRRQQAQLAERAARLRLQIALRDRKRVEGDDIDWT